MTGKTLTHLGPSGEARMVDVSDKAVTERTAIAEGRVVMSKATLDLVLSGNAKKGDVLGTARIAGIQAAKRTSEWIPLCHPVGLDSLEVDLTPDPRAGCLRIEARARVHARTGVEMEALVAVSAAALTVYDMCKAVDRGMTIERVRLVSKTGGKSGEWRAEGEPPREPGGRSRG